MRIRDRLSHAVREPDEFLSLARRAIELTREGHLGHALARLRARDMTAADYAAWHTLAEETDVRHARDIDSDFRCCAILNVDAGDIAPVVRSLYDQVRARIDMVVCGANGAWHAVTAGTNARRLPDSESAIDIGGCEWLLWVAEPVALARHAVATFALAAAANAGALVFYSDDDAVQPDGSVRPRFKPAWDRVQIAERPYAGPVLLIHRSIASLAMAQPYSGSSLQARAMREFAETLPDTAIVHIPAVLARRPASEPRSAVSGEDTSAAEGSPAIVSVGADKVRAGGSRASIVIPTRDRPRLLRRCIDSLRRHTPQEAYELIVVDNGTREPRGLKLLRDLADQPAVRVLRRDGSFNFAALCNAGVAAATGGVVILLNNDTEVVHDGWLNELATLAARPEIGAVGPLLVYPDGVVQSAGVFIGVNGSSTHVLNRRRPDSWIARSWLSCRRRVSAVTGACLAVERAKFDVVGGLDERFAVSHNEIDFCLRLQQRSWMNVFTPNVRVIHDEGGTRGFELHPDERARRRDEERRFLDCWEEVLAAGDPAHNPNYRTWGDAFALADPTIRRNPRRGWVGSTNPEQTAPGSLPPSSDHD